MRDARRTGAVRRSAARARQRRRRTFFSSLLEGDRILVGTSEPSLKAGNTKRDARVGVSIVAQDNLYVEAQIRGRIVERRPDPRLEVKDRISRKYTGKDFPWRDNPAQQVILVIEAERAKYAVLPFKHSPA